MRRLGGLRMNRRTNYFSKSDVGILSKNPYTYSVSEKTIRYTLAFKEAFWERYKAGKAPRNTFIELGYDPNIVGQKRIEGLTKTLKQSVAHGEALRQGRQRSLNKPPKDMDYAAMPPLRAIAAMQNELSYLRQEIEFLKKIIDLDNAARRKS